MQADMQKPSFFEELKRRRVIRVATLYVVVFWPLIQVVDILSPALGLADSAMRYLVFAFVAGLPIALIFAWIFDLNQGGIVVDSGETREETGPSLIGSKAELGIIGVMLLIVAGLFYVQTTAVEEIEPVATQASQEEVAPAASVSHDSIAVLPFDTFSDEARDRFFADGLTEELLNVLARVNGLQVAARTSSFAYRDTRKTVMEIGGELGVGVILEGSVRRSDIDNTIRVTAQLIDTTTGAHFWSNTYDREFTDVFKIQDEISSAVVHELKVTLLGGEEEELRSHATASPEAMILNTMGQTELAKRSETAMSDAIRFFERAIEEDPNYSDAWVGMADANSLMVSYGYGDREKHLAEAQKAVDKAVELDPTSGRAWASRGLLYRQEKKGVEAREALEKAISLDPSYAMAHMWYAGAVDDPDKSFSHFERAYKLDPRSPVAGYNVAQRYINRGREADAMDVFSKIVEADPYYPRAYDLVARISLNRGRLGDAIRHFEKAYELQPDANTAIQITDLMVSISNFSGAEEWLAIARELAAPHDAPRFDFIDIKRTALQGDDEGLRRALDKLSEPFAEGEMPYLVATQANYLKGDFAKVVEYWEKSEAIADDPNDPFDFDPSMLESARVHAAYAYRQLGNEDRVAELIEVAEANVEKQLAKPGWQAGSWYQAAAIDALQGEDQLAMINVQRAINEGWNDYWVLGIEPVFAELREQERLKTMIAGVETRMEMIREEMAFEESFAAAPRTAAPGS
jgi:TolB-like protein/tetratricopeptide (TPR) repeat protein